MENFLVVTTIIYGLGFFISALLIYPSELGNGQERWTITERVTANVLWPLVLCFAIADGLVLLWKRFNVGQEADDE